MSRAGRKRPWDPADERDVFAFPAPARRWAVFGIVAFLGLAGCCVALPWLDPQMSNAWLAPVLGVLFWTPLAAASARLLMRTRDRYRVSDRAITRLRPGREPVVLPWDRITRIVDHPGLGDLELHGGGPEGPIRFRLSYQLRDADRLRRAVMEWTDWAALVAGPGGSGGLPAVVYRTRFHMACRLAVCGWLAWAVVAGWSSGALSIWGALGIASAVLSFALLWYGVVVDQGSVTLLYPLRRRIIRTEQVAAFRLWVQPELGGSTVLVFLRNGERLDLRGARSGSLRLYRMLGEAFPGKAR